MGLDAHSLSQVRMNAVAEESKNTSQIFAKPFILPLGWATLLEMFVSKCLELTINNLKTVTQFGQIKGQMSALLPSRWRMTRLGVRDESLALSEGPHLRLL